MLTLFLSACAGAAAPPARADAAFSAVNSEDRVANPEAQLANLKTAMQQASSPSGMALFLCAAFCALWAQNTHRHPWL
jgi:hypothetical protein